MSLIEELDDAVRRRRRELSEGIAKYFHPSIRAILATKNGKDPSIIGSQFSKNRAPIKNRLYLAAGYPYSRNKKNVNNAGLTVKTSLSKYTAELTDDPAVAAEFKVSGKDHLFLKFHKFSETDAGDKQNTFAPAGLSGGPLFDLGNFASMDRYTTESSKTGYIAGITIAKIIRETCW